MRSGVPPPRLQLATLPGPRFLQQDVRRSFPSAPLLLARRHAERAVLPPGMQPPPLAGAPLLRRNVRIWKA